MKSKFLCGVVYGLLGLALSVSFGVRGASAQEIPDPLEPMNRGVFWFNEKFDHYLLEPVSDGYRFIMPKRGRQAVEHFFANLRYPKQFVSNVVSGKFSRAGIDTARFVINSTLGVAGFFEVAEEFGLERRDEDFGQALGYLGTETGAYVVLPFIGPRNVRDTFGLVVDTALDPLWILSQSNVRAGISDPITLGTQGVEIVNIRAELKDANDTAEESAVDKYLFVQGAFTQHREGEVWDGEPPEEPTTISPREYFSKRRHAERESGAKQK